MSLRTRPGALVALVAVALAACGGDEVEVLVCKTAHHVAGAVEAPTASQITSHLGRYQGLEGQYGMDGRFTHSGDASLWLRADATLSYQGVDLRIDSACLDKTRGPVGRVLYIEAGRGRFDIGETADTKLGQAWGRSPVDGTTVFRRGLKH